MELETEVTAAIERARRRVDNQTREPYDSIEDKCERMTVGEDGIPRWESNGSVPPDEILVQFLDGEPLRRAVRARIVEMRESIEAYKRRRADMSDDERAAERQRARGAFGPDATVVNVITGETIET